MHKVKLYNVPNNTKINVEHLNISLDGVAIDVMDFKHVDGMYSLCYFNGQVVHLSASTEVFVDVFD